MGHYNDLKHGIKKGGELRTGGYEVKNFFTKSFNCANLFPPLILCRESLNNYDKMTQRGNDWKGKKDMSDNLDHKLDEARLMEFPAHIRVEKRTSKTGNEYDIMLIQLENKETGEYITVHEVYIKENLRQILDFMIAKNK